MCRGHNDYERCRESDDGDKGGHGEGAPTLLPPNRTEVEETRTRQGEDDIQSQLLSKDNGAEQ